jgi:hypothetical protein
MSLTENGFIVPFSLTGLANFNGTINGSTACDSITVLGQTAYLTASSVDSNGNINLTLNIPTATSLVSGLLSAIDWTTFNNKQNTITASAPLNFSSNIVSINQSSTSQNGYLSSTDWNTFNDKAGLGLNNVFTNTNQFNSNFNIISPNIAFTNLGTTTETHFLAINNANGLITKNPVSSLSILTSNNTFTGINTFTNNIYFNSANTFSIYMPSTNKLRIGYNGGVPSPPTTSAYIDFDNTGNTTICGVDMFVFPRTIFSTNVGIGTFSYPSSKLHIGDGSTLSGTNIVRIDQGNGSYTSITDGIQDPFSITSLTSSPANLTLGMGCDTTNRIGYINVCEFGGVRPLYLNCRNNASVVVLGNLGVGTSTPAYKLDVSGTMGVSSTAEFAGNVGIGVTSPAYKLQVYSSSGALGIFGDAYFSSSVGIGRSPTTNLDVYNSSNSASVTICKLISEANPSGSSETVLKIEKGDGFGSRIYGIIRQGVGSEAQFAVINGGNVSNYIALTSNINNGGYFYVSTLGTGTVYSNAGWLSNTNPSDPTIKKNITSLNDNSNNICNIVLQLNPISFEWIDEKMGKGTKYGFSAKQISELIPDIASTFNDASGNIKYSYDPVSLIPFLTSALQTKSNKIDELENKISQLENDDGVQEEVILLKQKNILLEERLLNLQERLLKIEKLIDLA